ncbi:MAG TPA: hypothetical protein VMJ11_29230 [Paraburkholderia sp.]|uniref:hypothetical protein n=1 Tax=Paraburkholderia sp. TaxID=1926495 RepID=UPI002B696473|nr:hypothetical protein [Paraburkholderia sp.]HTR10667.1 hypothetical protein [Paraburkholderia sp.]
MTVIQVGLVDKTRTVDSAFMEAAAAAFNLQVMRDVPQFWNIQATVSEREHGSRWGFGPFFANCVRDAGGSPSGILTKRCPRESLRFARI